MTDQDKTAAVFDAWAHPGGCQVAISDDCSRAGGGQRPTVADLTYEGRLRTGVPLRACQACVAVAHTVPYWRVMFDE